LAIRISLLAERIHWQNLVNYGVLPLTLYDPHDYDRLAQGDVLVLEALHDLAPDRHVQARINGRGQVVELAHQLSQRQCDQLRAGGLVNWLKART